MEELLERASDILPCNNNSVLWKRERFASQRDWEGIKQLWREKRKPHDNGRNSRLAWDMRGKLCGGS